MNSSESQVSKFYCEKCNYKTDLKQSYLQHCKSELHKTGLYGGKELVPRKVLQCSLCDFNTTNVKNHLTHKLNNHSTKEERKTQFKYYCEKCDFGIFTESGFAKHNESTRHKRLNIANIAAKSS